MARRPVSGDRFRIEAAGYVAHIATIGATLRSLECDGRPLVRPFDADEVRPSFRGAVLAPWPNRVVDGTYEFDGVARQLALTEPTRHHAIHGLASWLDFAIVDRAPDAVALTATIEPQQGYPHRIDVRVDYRVDARGLHTGVVATNRGGADAPVALGTHPYLLAPGDRVDGWTLRLPAATVLEVTEDRLIPTGLAPVADSALGVDFRQSRTIGATFIDHAFTDIDRTDDGLAAVTVTDAHGVGSRIEWDARGGWVQVHTADKPDPQQSRRGLAVEPMTAPPDAFNSGTDLIRLAPDASTSLAWTIAAVG